MKLTRSKLFAAVVFGAGALATAASAHHTASMFDFTNTVTIEGTVKEFQFTNPHAWLILTAKGADGNAITYSFEMGTVSSIMRRGFARNSFVPGDKVTVRGHPMKDGRLAASFISAVTAAGKTLSMT